MKNAPPPKKLTEEEQSSEDFWNALSSIWNSIAGDGLEKFSNLKDQINKNSTLVLMDAKNREFQRLELEYEVEKSPYYVVIKSNKVISKGPIDAKYFEIVADKFKNHNIRETYAEAIEAPTEETKTAESEDKNSTVKDQTNKK